LENASGDLAPSRGQQPSAITLEYKGIFLAHPGKRRILNRIMAVGESLQTNSLVEGHLSRQ